MIQRKLDEEIVTDQYLDIQYRAYCGESLAEELIRSHIEDYLMEQGWLDTPFPECYSKLTEAIFQENFGWGPLSCWRELRAYSSGAKVIGTDIFFMSEEGAYVKQPFVFAHKQKVLDLCEKFKNMDRLNKLDRHEHSALETLTSDGVRISIMIPDRTVDDPVITLRNQTINLHSWEEQAKLQTIPSEAIALFRLLSKLNLKGVICGPPMSGKSTMLMTFMQETIYDAQTLYAESEVEFHPRKLFPGAPIIHVRATGHEWEEIVFPRLVRHDIEQIYVGEIRMAETEFFGQAGERGIRKLVGTFHSDDPRNIPGQLARLNSQHLGGNLDYHAEYVRFAENLHYSLTMDYINGKTKIVTGLQFYEVEPLTLQVSMYRVMKYDADLGQWLFYKKLPPRIQHILQFHQHDLLLEFEQQLHVLNRKFPMSHNKYNEIVLQARM